MRYWKRFCHLGLMFQMIWNWHMKRERGKGRGEREKFEKGGRTREKRTKRGKCCRLCRSLTRKTHRRRFLTRSICASISSADCDLEEKGKRKKKKKGG